MPILLEFGLENFGAEMSPIFSVVVFCEKIASEPGMEPAQRPGTVRRSPHGVNVVSSWSTNPWNLSKYVAICRLRPYTFVNIHKHLWSFNITWYYLCNIYLYFYKWYVYFFFLLSSFRDFPNWKRFENTSLRALTQKTFQWNAVLKSKSLNFLPVFSNQSLPSMLSNMLAKVVGSMIVICLCCVSISSSSSKVRLNNRIPKKSKRFWTFSSMQKRQFRLRRTRGTRGTSAFRLLRCGSPRWENPPWHGCRAVIFLLIFSRTFQEKFPKDPPKKIGTNTLLQVFEKTFLEKNNTFLWQLFFVKF